jgi:hypothetical protein
LKDPGVLARDNDRSVFEGLYAASEYTADVAQIAVGVRQEPGSELRGLRA